MPRAAMVVSLALLALCTHDDKVFDPDEAELFTGQIRGCVTDAYGEDLSGVLITVQPEGLTTVSGPDGAFTLSDVTPGTHCLYASCIDYRDTLTDSLTLGLDESVTLQDNVVLVYRYGWVRGRVSVPGQTISPLDAGLQVEFQEASGRTYPNGDYLLLRVEPGDIRLYAAVSGVGYGTQVVTVDADDTADADIAIDRTGGTVTGTVTDTAGDPLEGVVVEAVGGVLADTTDSAGTYTLTEVPSEGDVCLAMFDGTNWMTIGGVEVGEGGTLSMPSLTMRSLNLDSAVGLLPATVLANEDDTAIVIVLSAETRDSTVRIARYDWDLDDDGRFDTSTAIGILAVAPRSAGVYTMRARCLTNDTTLSPIVDIAIIVAPVAGNVAPVLVGGSMAMTATAVVGVEYVDTVRAFDADGDTVNVFLQGTPPIGLTLTDSIIRWTPADTGRYQVRVWADDQQGGRDSVTWTITVTSAAALSFTQRMPPDITVEEKDTITLFVGVSGPQAITYQWYHDGGLIAGAADSTYFIDTAEYADSGLYVVEVTNGIDTIRDSAFLKVQAPGAGGPWMPAGPQDLTFDSHGMVQIRAAGFHFTMGQVGVPDAEPEHEVNFTQDFWMDTTEVTQDLYQTVTALNPSQGITEPSHPVDNVSWHDAAWFCNERSKRDGFDTVYTYTSITGTPGDGCVLVDVKHQFHTDGYRLPTEAEWEYACRGGTTAEWYWGPDTASKYAWYDINSSAVVQAVAGRFPNAYGLLDMSGNVAEWCSDWHETPYPVMKPADPTGPDSSLTNSRVQRGGAFADGAANLRCAARFAVDPSTRDNTMGFRCVRMDPPADMPPDIYAYPPDTLYAPWGDTLIMHAQVTGTWPMDFHWFKEGAPIDTGTTPEYRRAPVDSSVEGEYFLVAANAYGSDTTPTWYVKPDSTGGAAQPWVAGGALEHDTLGAVKVLLKGHGFLMGQGGLYAADPEHQVSFGHDLWVDTAEVTQGEFSALMSGNNPSAQQNVDYPVYGMSWYDAVLFCNARSNRDGLTPVYMYDSVVGMPGQGVSSLVGLVQDFNADGYRLPTEAEWEYLCRAATSTDHYWGDDSTSGTVSQYEWYSGNSGSMPGPVGSRIPNAYDLYDMSGNVMEWVHDWFDDQYYSTSPGADPMGPASSPDGVTVRGGSFMTGPDQMQCARRMGLDPASYQNGEIGFRCVRTIP